MKLSYRGNDYETNLSPLEVRETEVTGKYRGTSWRRKLPKHIPQLQPKIYLQYRGVAYSSRPHLQQPIKCVDVPLHKPEFQKIVVQNTEQIYLENLRRNLEHRLQVARAEGNQHLVSLLEKESKQLKLQIQAR